MSLHVVEEEVAISVLIDYCKMGKGGKSDRLNVKEENMVAWLVSTNTLKIQPFKLLPLGPYDVRVRMKVVGICNSNVHYLKVHHHPPHPF
uniref:Uncharacterized protein n=1 Tax=Lactuca sativa TaxID=4236 RepID=A0A9R1V6K2_LACSA|nr:hypothetical protein LSAT_V11C600323450 [Lactuca sativa]